MFLKIATKIKDRDKMFLYASLYEVQFDEIICSAFGTSLVACEQLMLNV